MKMMIDYKYEADAWLDYESKRQRIKKHFPKKFIGSRGYPHLDATINIFDAEQLGKLKHKLSYSKNIVEWPFLPFIRKDQRNRRYKHKPKKYKPVESRNQKKYTHIKSRPIMYASHHDACLYAFVGYILNKPYEERLQFDQLSSNVIAYRSIDGANNVVFAKQAFDFLENHDDWACILIDIRGFFDNVPHSILHDSLEKVLAQELDGPFKHVLRNITKYRYLIEDEAIKELRRNKKSYYIPIGKKSRKLAKIEDFNKHLNNRRFIRNNTKNYGIPQGSPISGLLANIFLLEFDGWLKNEIEKSRISFYQRYCDDMLIVCDKFDAEQLYTIIKTKLGELGLGLSTNKTEMFIKTRNEISNAVELIEPRKSDKRENIQYLGLEWDGKQIILRPSTIGKRMRPSNKLAKKYWEYHGKAITRVKSKAMKKQLYRLRRTIKKQIEGSRKESNK